MNPAQPVPLRLGIAEGVTPTTWVRRWKERFPHSPLDLVPLPAVGGERALRGAGVDAAILRTPEDTRGLHVIPLYEERAVVVVPRDHYLTAADELSTVDLVEEIVHQPVDAVHWDAPTGKPADHRPADSLGAVRLVGSGVGIVILPESIARAHHRKDLTYLPVIDLPATPVGLCWRDGEGAQQIEDLIGVIRGRTARSTRGAGVPPAPKRTAAQKAAARREYLASRGKPRGERGPRRPKRR